MLSVQLALFSRAEDTHSHGHVSFAGSLGTPAGKRGTSTWDMLAVASGEVHGATAHCPLHPACLPQHLSTTSLPASTTGNPSRTGEAVVSDFLLLHCTLALPSSLQPSTHGGPTQCWLHSPTLSHKQQVFFQCLQLVMNNTEASCSCLPCLPAPPRIIGAHGPWLRSTRMHTDYLHVC